MYTYMQSGKSDFPDGTVWVCVFLVQGGSVLLHFPAVVGCLCGPAGAGVAIADICYQGWARSVCVCVCWYAYVYPWF